MQSSATRIWLAAHLKQARLCHEQGNLRDALALYQRIIDLDAGNFSAFHEAGIIYGQLGQFEQALQFITSASKLKPSDFSIYYNQAKALQELKRHNEALISYDKVLALKPDYVPAYNNRGNILKELQRYDAALDSYNKALSIRSDFLVAYINRASVLQDLKRYDEAVAAYDQAIALKPDYAEANYNKGLVKLLLGDYEAGWPLQEWRWKTDQYKGLVRSFKQPLWLGTESPAGRTILLYADQGIGDAIQIARYVPMVATLGAKVILEVQSQLVPLLKTIDGSGVTVIAKGGTLPEFEFQCPLMSLPLAFKTTISTIPQHVPYLAADPQKQLEWRERLGQKILPRVGLAWSGNAMHKNDCNRSISLRSFEPLLCADFEYHSLQKEIRQEDKEILAEFSEIHVHDAELHNFSDSAALVSELDMVITVDTAVAHLAGAMGKEVWILLPYIADFRWMTERSDSPWYPSAQLFRQDSRGDWGSVITKLHSKLKKKGNLAFRPA